VDITKEFLEINSGTLLICNRFLVGRTGENWNCVFKDLIQLYEQLQELDIEAIMKN